VWLLRSHDTYWGSCSFTAFHFADAILLLLDDTISFDFGRQVPTVNRTCGSRTSVLELSFLICDCHEPLSEIDENKPSPCGEERDVRTLVRRSTCSIVFSSQTFSDLSGNLKVVAPVVFFWSQRWLSPAILEVFKWLQSQCSQVSKPFFWIENRVNLLQAAFGAWMIDSHHVYVVTTSQCLQ
jgi:hypothetical protein